MSDKPKILFSVLNWGLGHASRSIPLIQLLDKMGFEVHIASSGQAMELLEKECSGFPKLKLPDYNIKYPTKSMVLNLAGSFSSLVTAVRKEHEIVQSYGIDNDIQFTISDNRLGTYIDNGYNVFITHQLLVPSATKISEAIATRIHDRFMKSFDEVWIPDLASEKKLAGRLSSREIAIRSSFLGPITRFQPSLTNDTKRDIDWLVVLSGPEPARTKFEEKLVEILTPTDFKVVLVKGREGKFEKIRDSFDVMGLLTESELLDLFFRAKAFCGRSGYSTILDLTALSVPALLVPTPGQPEQEYVAKHLKNEWGMRTCTQSELSISHFEEIPPILRAPQMSERIIKKVINESLAMSGKFKLADYSVAL